MGQAARILNSHSSTISSLWFNPSENHYYSEVSLAHSVNDMHYWRHGLIYYLMHLRDKHRSKVLTKPEVQRYSRWIHLSEGDTNPVASSKF